MATLLAKDADVVVTMDGGPGSSETPVFSPATASSSRWGSPRNYRRPPIGYSTCGATSCFPG